MKDTELCSAIILYVRETLLGACAREDSGPMRLAEALAKHGADPQHIDKRTDYRNWIPTLMLVNVSYAVLSQMDPGRMWSLLSFFGTHLRATWQQARTGRRGDSEEQLLLGARHGM